MSENEFSDDHGPFQKSSSLLEFEDTSPNIHICANPAVLQELPSQTFSHSACNQVLFVGCAIDTS